MWGVHHVISMSFKTLAHFEASKIKTETTTALTSSGINFGIAVRMICGSLEDM